MLPKVYVDGQAGTTGLEIVQRLKNRSDLQLLEIEEDKRHDEKRRKELMLQADLVFLCLPDEASVEAAEWLENMDCKVIDTSTAHRTTWVYGLPELSSQQEAEIRQAKMVANPGCHATGFILLVYPLIACGLIDPCEVLSCFSITGYTGGGKKMIAQYEDKNRSQELDAPRLYGLDGNHKHLPEMTKISGLEYAPVFVPVVADYPRGMAVSIELDPEQFIESCYPDQIQKVYEDWYLNQPLIEAFGASSGMIAANEMAGKDTVKLYVNGGPERIVITAVFDNLGKGASGAAIENMNLMLGLNKLEGLKF